MRNILVLVALFVLFGKTADAQVKLKFIEGGNDYFYYHGQVYDPNLNPSKKEIRLVLKNSKGVVYSETIPAGACVDQGQSCVYTNETARQTKSGLFFFRILYDNGNHGNKFYVKSYQEFQNADEQIMTLTFYVNGYRYAEIDRALFEKKPRGWVWRFGSRMCSMILGKISCEQNR